MENIRKRYDYGGVIEKHNEQGQPPIKRTYNRSRIVFPSFSYKEKWQSYIRAKKYAPIRKFYNVAFERKLYEYSRMQYFSMDFQDKFLNTPLHTASQYGNEKCVEKLIEEYHLSITVRNYQGWMPKDL